MNILRYSILNSVLALVAASAIYFYNALGLLIIFDPTKISLIILSIVVLTIIYIGVRQDKVEHWLIKWIARLLPVLGLIGTITGAMMLLHAFGTAGNTDPTQLAQQLMVNMAPAFLTTVSGAGGLGILLLELVVAYGRKGDDENHE